MRVLADAAHEELVHLGLVWKQRLGAAPARGVVECDVSLFCGHFLFLIFVRRCG